MKITKFFLAETTIVLIILLSGCVADSHHLRPNIVVNPDQLYTTVKRLVTMEPARSFNNPLALDSAADYIKSRFLEFGLTPVEQGFRINGELYKNIIASYGPENAPVFIVGAHYDVFDELPGADDNASGVAGIIELARLIGATKPVLNYRIEFVVFTLEEPPFFRTQNMGSFVHAKSLFDNNSEVIGMACLEMIGYYSDDDSSQEYPISLMKLFYPTTGNFIAVISNFDSSELSSFLDSHLESTTLNTERLNAPSFITGVDFSDHLNYWHFGYKAVMITDTSFFRNHNYHNPTDTIDTLDFNKMAEVVKGVYWALINLRAVN